MKLRGRTRFSTYISPPAAYYGRAAGLASRLPAALDLPDLRIVGVAGEERGGTEPARPGGLVAGFATVADTNRGAAAAGQFGRILLR